MDFLNERKKAGGPLVNDWAHLEELYSKKLWHQLTLKTLEIVQRPELQSQTSGSQPVLLEMYDRFISDFEHRINPLSLVEICLHIVRSCTDPALSVHFLTRLQDKIGKHESQLPHILIKTAIGVIHLQQKSLAEAKKLVEELDSELSAVDGVTSIHTRYYEFSSAYYRDTGNHAEYYRNALRYLGCLDSSKLDSLLSLDERRQRAYYLALAALLGEGVYNFGELLMHPILSALGGTSDQWIVDLLFAFNKGDLARFDALRGAWSQQADLKANEVQLRQKICLLCLMEMAFTRPASNKQLAFGDIAARTNLPEAEVELLVMRALSLGLVKGSIDQIDRKVFVSWVQPRVLDLDQVKMMKTRLDAWSLDVNRMVGQIQTNLHEILT